MAKKKIKTTKKLTTAIAKSHNMIILLAGAALVILFALAANYVEYLRRAHSTFENYYVFRGCTKLLQKTDSYAYCRLEDGKTIKLVLYQNKWYLDGDLPNCVGKLCF